MRALDDLEIKLKTAAISFSRNSHGISIERPVVTGFSIDITRNDEEWIVDCENLHVHIADDREMIELVGFCLSDQCRLVVRRGWLLHRARLEMRTEDGWRTLHSFGALAPSLFETNRDAILANDVIVTGVNPARA